MAEKKARNPDACIPSPDEVEKAVEGYGRINYVITKPVNGLRRVVVLRRQNLEMLKEPVEFTIPADLKPEDEVVLDHMIQSICRKVPKLMRFAAENSSMWRMTRYYLLYRTGSQKTICNYAYHIYRVCQYLGKSPDQLIEEASRDPRAIEQHVRGLENYLLLLKSMRISPSYIIHSIQAMKALYKANGLRLEMDHPIRSLSIYPDRAPRPEELQRLLEYASLREKVIISMLALGGFRLGTLTRLKYRHVKHDLEAGITPIHIHVEAEITKGKYCDYDTFIGNEAVEYLKLYLEQRRRRGEIITDDSPLIASAHKPPIPLTEISVYKLINRLYRKAGLIGLGERMHPLRVHSLRKFFRTQLTARGVPAEYVEYMMGHKTSRYNDVKSLGVEFLRNLYKLADLSIRPKPLTEEQIIKILNQAIREMARRAGIKLLEEEIEPAAYIKAEESSSLEKLSLELEAILKHMLAKAMEENRKALKPCNINNPKIKL